MYALFFMLLLALPQYEIYEINEYYGTIVFVRKNDQSLRTTREYLTSVSYQRTEGSASEGCIYFMLTSARPKHIEQLHCNKRNNKRTK